MDLEPESRLTRRFELRPFRKRDAEPLLDAVVASLTDLHKWLPWAHLGYNRMDATRYVRETAKAWREGRAYDFAIRRHDDADYHVGNISIWHVSRPFRVGEIGYWVRSDETSRGVGTEVTARLVQVGFEELNLHRIVLRIAIGNRGSERIAEKLGFTREGILREEIKVAGAWLDHTVYSLLEDEFDRRRQDYERVSGSP